MANKHHHMTPEEYARVLLEQFVPIKPVFLHFFKKKHRGNEGKSDPLAGMLLSYLVWNFRHRQSTKPHSPDDPDYEGLKWFWWFHVSFEKVFQATGITEDVQPRVLKTLEDAGFITVHKGGERNRRWFYVHMDKVLERTIEVAQAMLQKPEASLDSWNIRPSRSQKAEHLLADVRTNREATARSSTKKTDSAACGVCETGGLFTQTPQATESRLRSLRTPDSAGNGLRTPQPAESLTTRKNHKENQQHTEGESTLSETVDETTPDVVVVSLQEVGVTEVVARDLVRRYPLASIALQIDYLPHRKVVG